MKVHVILAGLKKDNVENVLQRMEALAGGLPADSEYTIYQSGCEACLEEIRGWASCRKLAAAGAKEFCADNGDLILLSGTAEGKELGMRLAAALKKPCRTEVTAFEEAYGELMAVRKVYSTHLDGLYPAAGSVAVAAANGEKKEYIPAGGQKEDELDESTVIPVPAFELFAGKLIQMDDLKDQLIHEEKLEKKEDLAGAKLVLLGGKGLGKKENFERLEALAEKLGASCGCTRPVAMAGWASYDKVVGLSGSILSADVCIAFGVSGAGPLMTGASGAKRLIAVNSDPKAPIFSQCSDGIVADCLEILAAMEAAEA